MQERRNIVGGEGFPGDNMAVNAACAFRVVVMRARLRAFTVCVMVAAVQLSSLARAARHETQPETCRVSSQPAQPTNPSLVKPKK